MKNLYHLIKGFKLLKSGKSYHVLHITNNSKNLKPYSIFFAIRGTRVDGHTFLKTATVRGATTVVIEDKKWLNHLPESINVIHTDNVRKAQAVIASRFFDEPSKDLNIIGITGTNGKTTTSHLISQYLALLGEKTGVIGTVGYKFQNKVLATGQTTPDSIKWQKLLKEMKDLGARYVVAEVSSHGIDQYRVYSTRFKGLVFTNLTQDHLDYHKTMENYFQTKRKLFLQALETDKGTVFSINVDDLYGQRLYDEFESRKETVSYGKKSNYLKLLGFSSLPEGLTIKVQYKGKNTTLKSNLRGDFNVYNILGAISVLTALGFDFDTLADLTEKLTPVKGRFEVIPAKDFIVVNDYAHTPDALEKLLKSLRPMTKGRLILVFGAGGDRDKAKRPLMGKVAEHYADTVILTSDNPRSEDPVDIIHQIKQGMKKVPLEIVDREEAIREAIRLAKTGDAVVIAGKGHETYQIVGDKVFHFDDSNVAKKYLKLLGKDA